MGQDQAPPHPPPRPLTGTRKRAAAGGLPRVSVLGSGDAPMEAAFRGTAEADPANVSVTIGYDEAFAHRIMAGCDVIMVPSR